MIHIPDWVYDKNESGQSLCPRCQKTLALCDCPDLKKKNQPALRAVLPPRVSLSKGGRHGKVVTVISALPHDEVFLKETAKVLKKRFGCGGTVRVEDGSGVIEIQGDRVEEIREWLQQEFKRR